MLQFNNWLLEARGPKKGLPISANPASSSAPRRTRAAQRWLGKKKPKDPKPKDPKPKDPKDPKDIVLYEPNKPRPKNIVLYEPDKPRPVETPSRARGGGFFSGFRQGIEKYQSSLSRETHGVNLSGRDRSSTPLHGAVADFTTQHGFTPVAGGEGGDEVPLAGSHRDRPSAQRTRRTARQAGRSDPESTTTDSPKYDFKLTNPFAKVDKFSKADLKKLPKAERKKIKRNRRRAMRHSLGKWAGAYLARVIEGPKHQVDDSGRSVMKW
jgi:hypothetical protein